MARPSTLYHIAATTYIDPGDDSLSHSLGLFVAASDVCLITAGSGSGSGAIPIHEPVLFQEPFHPPHLGVIRSAGTY